MATIFIKWAMTNLQFLSQEKTLPIMITNTTILLSQYQCTIGVVTATGCSINSYPCFLATKPEMFVRACCVCVCVSVRPSVVCFCCYSFSLNLWLGCLATLPAYLPHSLPIKAIALGNTSSKHFGVNIFLELFDGLSVSTSNIYLQRYYLKDFFHPFNFKIERVKLFLKRMLAPI